LSTFAGLLQYGGRQLRCLTERDYLDCPGPVAMARMLTDGVAYRHGFLVNAAELTSLVHLPPVGIPPSSGHPTHLLVQRSLGHQLSDVSDGVDIGRTRMGDELQPARIPSRVRMYQTHVVGAQGTGKSTALAWMILQDCLARAGVAVIDPHGLLIQDILDRLPLECIDRVVHLEFGSRSRVPIFNPLQCVGDADPDRVAADFVAALRRVVEGWGDRLEHLLRSVLRGIARLPKPTLADVSEVLADGPRYKQLKHDVLARADDVLLRRFWQSELARYKAAERAPVLHKLSKLLSEEPLASMLTQSSNLIDLTTIQRRGEILLVDLSGLSDDARTVLGSLLIALLRVAALSRWRAGANEPLRPFHVFVDESHRFVTPAMRELLVEGRKFQVSLTVAHQYLEQYSRADVNALSTAGSTIAFRVGEEDAARLQRKLNSRVEAETIANLPVHTAFARIGDEVLRVETANLPPKSPAAVRAAIRAASSRYYRDTTKAGALTGSSQGTQAPQSPFAGHQGFIYDELD
jgi:hypothetical protein